MSLELLAEIPAGAYEGALAAEPYIAEGENILCAFELNYPPSASEIAPIIAGLQQHEEFRGWNIDSHRLYLQFQKGNPALPLLLAGGLILVAGALGALFIYRITENSFPWGIILGIIGYIVIMSPITQSLTKTTIEEVVKPRIRELAPKGA